MVIIIRKDSDFTDLLQNNLKARYEKRRRNVEDSVHVSDILPSTCIRKQYFSRKNPEMDEISNESLQHFLRGESSEAAITSLADLGVSQKDLEMDGLIAHPDIMNEDLIVELKDTLSNKRLNINDHQFKSYLRQLLYYLVITGIEKGIISIRYNNRELRWLKTDPEGNDYFIRPKNSRSPEIESWSVYLPKDDIARELLKNEMIRRKTLFQRSLKESNISILPRLREDLRSSKCPWCRFYDICMDKENDETSDAREMVKEIDLLDISGFVDFKPFNS
jgi:CRISPR/Cas system-associated exonuclease Cas4 (RecB family)